MARKVMKKLTQEMWNAIMWGWPRLKICAIRTKQEEVGRLKSIHLAVFQVHLAASTHRSKILSQDTQTSAHLDLLSLALAVDGPVRIVKRSRQGADKLASVAAMSVCSAAKAYIAFFYPHVVCVLRKKSFLQLGSLA